MKNEFDVIVIGARCAGATVTIELGKAGYQVLLLDESIFPSETLSTSTFMSNSVYHLEQLGVMSFLDTSSAPMIQQALYQFDDIVIEGEIPPYKGENRCYNISRFELDWALFRKADSFYNVTSIQGFVVTELLKRDGQVIGVMGKTRSGETFEFISKMVIGADGRQSIVRKALRLKPIQEVFSDYACFYATLSGVKPLDPHKIEMYRIEDSLVAAFPSKNERHVVHLKFPSARNDWLVRLQNDPEKAFLEILKTQYKQINFHERMMEASVEGKVFGLNQYSNYWYDGMGKGWALVGDAVIFKEPAVGHGIYDAIYSARYLASLLINSADWEMNIESLISTYNNHLLEKFSDTFQLSIVQTKHHSDSSEERNIQRVLSENEELQKKFFGLYTYSNTLQDLTESIIERSQEGGQGEGSVGK